MNLSTEQKAILDHTMHRTAGGLYCGGGRDIDALVDAGMMVEVGRKSFVPEAYFRITNKGREALK